MLCSRVLSVAVTWRTSVAAAPTLSATEKVTLYTPGTSVSTAQAATPFLSNLMRRPAHPRMLSILHTNNGREHATERDNEIGRQGQKDCALTKSSCMEAFLDR